MDRHVSICPVELEGLATNILVKFRRAKTD
jgi:hypothetical protein